MVWTMRVITVVQKVMLWYLGSMSRCLQKRSMAYFDRQENTSTRGIFKLKLDISIY